MSWFRRWRPKKGCYNLILVKYYKNGGNCFVSSCFPGSMRTWDQSTEPMWNSKVWWYACNPSARMGDIADHWPLLANMSSLLIELWASERSCVKNKVDSYWEKTPEMNLCLAHTCAHTCMCTCIQINTHYTHTQRNSYRYILF